MVKVEATATKMNPTTNRIADENAASDNVRAGEAFSNMKGRISGTESRATLPRRSRDAASHFDEHGAKNADMTLS